MRNGGASLRWMIGPALSLYLSGRIGKPQSKADKRVVEALGVTRSSAYASPEMKSESEKHNPLVLLRLYSYRR